MAECSPDPYLRLLRHHYPRLARGTATSELSTACSTPANCEEHRRPSSRGALWEEKPRLEAEVKETSLPQGSLAGRHWSDACGGLGSATKLQPPVHLVQDLANASERCPHCTRVFSKEAAGRHVPICSQIKSRPKPPPSKDPESCFTDSLGRRSSSRPGTSKSRPGTAGTCRTAASPLNVATPSRAYRSTSRAGTPSSVGPRRLSMAEDCHKSRPATSGEASPLNVSTPSRACRGSSRAGTPSSVGAKRLSMAEECHKSRPATSGEAMPGPLNVLSEQWQMLQFILRNGLDAFYDDNAITATSCTVDQSLHFLGSLEDWAMQLKMRKGALSRMLLPFDSETDSGDQASSAALAPLGSQELDGQIHNDERRKLVMQAVALRRLIRVKVADCNDIEQAREALKIAASFLHELKRKASEETRTMTSVLREL